MAQNKLVTIEQLDSAVDGFAAEVKAADFEKKANLKALAYADEITSSLMSSSLTTILAAKMSNTDAQNIVAGEVGMAYRPGGSYAFENLPAAGASNYGVVYHVTNDFVTDNRFAEGADKKYSAGTEVGVILQEKAQDTDPDVYIYNVFSGFIDTAKFAAQSSFTTFKTALDNLEVATNSDIQSLIDGLSLEDPAVLAPGTYDENDNLLKSWDQLVADGDVIVTNDVLSTPNGVETRFANTKKFVIDQSVTSIDYAAFYNCASLTSITIPNSVTSIGVSAFDSCTSLTTINIPDSVTSIGDQAFGSCTGLTEITIPNSVTSIGTGVFNNCANLATIHYSGTATGAPWGATNATVVA